MKQDLICTLCDNHCPLHELGCLKGQRFYERNDAPYCTLCDNHCLLSALQCSKGINFYGTGEQDFRPVHLHQPKPSTNLLTQFEICTHQFRRVRGGQSSQIRVLRFLHNHGSITQRELQNALVLKPATMSELISRLEAQNLIVRAQSEQDKRINVLHLTPEGESAFAQQANFEEQLRLFSALTPEEQELFGSFLERLQKDWGTREEKEDSSPGAN